MPIQITVSKTFTLSDLWCDEEGFKNDYAQDHDAFIEDCLEEDTSSFLDEAGGLKGIIQKVEWVD